MTVQVCGWTLETEKRDDALIVRLPGHRELLNVYHLKTLSEEMYRLFTSENVDRLVLDFTEVNFLHSDALDQFIALQKRLQSGGGSLSLWNVDSHLFSALEATQLAEFLNARTDSPV